MISNSTVTLNGVTLPNGTVETITISSKSSAVSAKYEDETEYNGSASSSIIQTPVVITVTHNNPNYVQTVSIIKNVSVNAVAHNGSGTFYSTIERSMAIVKDGTVYVIPSLGIDVPINDDITIESGVTLALPFEGTTYNGRQTGSDSSKWFDDNGMGIGNCVTNVTIKEDVTVTINGALAIGGILGYEGPYMAGHTSGNYASITMYDGSTINSSGTIECYGFIFDESSSNKPSIINIDNGDLYMPFVVYDYKGGSSTVGAYQSEQISPFNTYDLPNIYSMIVIDSSSTLYGMADLFTSAVSVSIINVPAQHNNATPKLISSSGALINLSSGSTATIKYSGNKTTLKLSGSASFGSLVLGISVMGINRSIDTSTVYFPLSYKYDIILDGNGTFTMNNKLKLLPGASLTVEYGSTLEIGTSGEMIVYSQFPDKSQISPYPINSSSTFIVNGTLKIDGRFGGEISSTNSSAKLIISEGATLSATSLEGDGAFDTSKVSIGGIMGGLDNVINSMCMMNESTKWTANEYANGLVDTSAGPMQSKFHFGTYLSKNSIWCKEGTINITYHSNYPTNTISNTFVSKTEYSGAQISSNNVGISVPNYYEFGGWYFDSQCTQLANGISVYGDIELYAKWNSISYTLSYDAEFLDGSSYPYANTNENKYTSISKGSIITLDPASADGWIFMGWYINEQLIDNNLLTSDMVTDNSVIIAKFVSNPVVTFNYVQEATDENIKITDLNVTSISNGDGTYSLSIEQINNANNAKDSLNSNTSITQYTDEKWYYINNENIEVEFTETTTFTSSVTVYAKWYSKYYIEASSITNASIKVNNESLTVNNKLYFKKGISISVEFAYTKAEDQHYTINGGSKQTGETYTIESIDANYTLTAYSKDPGCFVEGTLITMFDGSKKQIQELEIGEYVLVFDHETGQYSYSPIIAIGHKNDSYKEFEIINLEFSNGESVKIVYEHALYNLTLNKYVYINNNNYLNYIGDVFYSENGQFTLINAYITIESTKIYAPVTAYHINCFANGFLSWPADAEPNFFEFSKDMKYDEEKMYEDIKKYGLYTYDDFKEYITYDIYCLFPFKYYKISVEKGYITFKEIIDLLNNYVIES